MTQFLLSTRGETVRFGEALGRRLQGGEVLALNGDLGAGKTTLAQSIARGMGILSPVSSPTFALIHEYPGRIPLFHFDPYRLSDPRDLYEIGFEEYFERGGVVLVEWADKVADLLPLERLTLRLEIVPNVSWEQGEEETPRHLEAKAEGERYERMLAALAAAPEVKDLIARENEA